METTHDGQANPPHKTSSRRRSASHSSKKTPKKQTTSGSLEALGYNFKIDSSSHISDDPHIAIMSRLLSRMNEMESAMADFKQKIESQEEEIFTLKAQFVADSASHASQRDGANASRPGRPGRRSWRSFDLPDNLDEIPDMDDSHELPPPVNTAILQDHAATTSRLVALLEDAQNRAVKSEVQVRELQDANKKHLELIRSLEKALSKKDKRISELETHKGLVYMEPSTPSSAAANSGEKAPIFLSPPTTPSPTPSPRDRKYGISVPPRLFIKPSDQPIERVRSAGRRNAILPSTPTGTEDFPAVDAMKKAYEERITDLSDRLAECHSQLVAARNGDPGLSNKAFSTARFRVTDERDVDVDPEIQPRRTRNSAPDH